MKAALVTVAFLIFAVGWWLPNAHAWENCGAPPAFSYMRGTFEKPDALSCLSAAVNGTSTGTNSPNEGKTPCSEYVANPITCYNTWTPAPDVPSADPTSSLDANGYDANGCHYTDAPPDSWAAGGQWWAHRDGSPC
jgi:hypothetical protein